MRLTFLGHACFLITLENGRRLLLDPYLVGPRDNTPGFQPLTDPIDWVALSHEHADHADLSWVTGQPRVIRDAYRDADIRIDMGHAAHDELGGNLRSGSTRLLRIEAEGITVVHCGDLGERLLEPQWAPWAGVDVLIVPVGGYFTLGGEGAAQLVLDARPRYAVPCHYQTWVSGFSQLSSVDGFLRRFQSRRRAWPVVEADILDPARAGSGPTTIVSLRPVGVPRKDKPRLGG